jgi:hypothetical protein
MINVNNQDTWTSSNDIHIVDNGEMIQFPVNFNGSELKTYQASLLMKRNGKIIENMFSRIKL